MDRFSISLSQEELKVVAHAVDASLCVQESLEEAETGDRVKAIDRLAGAQIMKDARYPHNIVKRCRIKLAAPGTQKRRSNWPATPEGRARVKRRTAELRARNVPSPFGRVSVSGDEYIPAHREKAVLQKLKSQVAALVGIDAEALSQPHALISMVNSGGADRRLFTRDGVGVTVSLYDDTESLEMMAEDGALYVPDSLEAGEALAFDRRMAHREPMGDYRRIITFVQRS